MKVIQIPPWEVQQYFQLPSTQQYLLEQLQTTACSHLVVQAQIQSAGIGRRWRTWETPATPNVALTFSFSSEYRGPLSQVTWYGHLVAVACAQVLSEISKLPVQIKWPNDIVIVQGDIWYKVGGIRLDLRQIGKRNFVVAGVGINLNQDAAQIPAITVPNPAYQASSLYLLSGERYEVTATLSRLLQQIHNWEQQLRHVTHYGHSKLATVYRELSLVLGQELQVYKIETHMPALTATTGAPIDTLENAAAANRNLGTPIQGRAHSIGPAGELILDTQDGLVHLSAEEVHQTRKPGPKLGLESAGTEIKDLL